MDTCRVKGDQNLFMEKKKKTQSNETYLLVKLGPINYLLGEGTDDPLQHSCLENAMDRGAW